MSGELAQVPAVRRDPRVGAHRDLHAGRDGPLDRLPVDVDEFGRLADAGGRDRRAGRHGIEDALGRHERRDQPRAALQHHLDRLVVEEDAVLDAADAGPDGGLDPGRPLGMGHDRDAGGVRLGDQDVQLVVAEVPVARVVARRQDPARGAHLDLVGAGPDDLARRAAHLVRAVHDARSASRGR